MKTNLIGTGSSSYFDFFFNKPIKNFSNSKILATLVCHSGKLSKILFIYIVILKPLAYN